MAAATQSTEQATASLQNLTIESPTPSAEAPETKKETSLSTEVVDTESSDQTVDAPGPVRSSDESSTPGPQDMTQANMFPTQNNYPPQTYYYGGYESPVAEWEEYPRYINMDGVEIASPAVYDENGSILYHPGYAYAPQMPYGPYSPAGSPLTTFRTDGQVYSPQPFQYPGPFFQQPVPSGSHYISSPTPVSHGDVPNSVGADQTSFPAEGSNANFFNGSGVNMSPRHGYSVTYSSYPRGGVSPVTNNSPRYQDSRHGYDGMKHSSSWTDSTRASQGQQRPTSTAVTSVISQPTPLGPFGQNFRPTPHVMPHIQGPQQPRATSGIGPAPPTFNRLYTPNRLHPPSYGRSGPGYGGNGRTWIAVDKSKPRGRGNGSLCNCIGSLDVLNEQNRGPRTARFRNQSVVSRAMHKEQGHNESNNVGVDSELYNRPDFVTQYKDAKFFIIKSYSEDNVHKSIKYGVWASTPNGNKKLDAAYKEAQEKPGGCPVFLFFSVNASGQFCGVAEMCGPVDFQSSVDYWQQDKWSGQFPVKWHIVKDVANSQFWHIILENNDNKPVTNSRDTQEVKFEQGTEMLNILKNHVCKTSILDDFQFYEGREKAMQEKRVRQEVSYQAGVEIGQDKFLKVSEGKTVEDRDDANSRHGPAELLDGSPSLVDGLSREVGINRSRQRSFLEEISETSSTGDTVKPTIDEASATQVGAEDENLKLDV
uniref:TSA: Wollemia nobilis Ref_Wollemi_Transcript_19055_2823 transcribed RNA sequence n=1 Tax=Wollemia nobilis TaxID=56998 RepID=A0A0C9RI09_9CONI